MIGYVPLHVHYDWGSKLDSMVKPVKPSKKEPCAIAIKCQEYNIPALACTDHGTMVSVISHYKTCKEHGIKGIIGMEAYITDDLTVKDKTNKYNHLILLAKNDVGYKNIKKLSTIGNLDGFYYKPRIDFKTLCEHKDGVIVLTACLGSELDRLILSEDYDELDGIMLINKYKKVFGDDYYLEMQSADSEEQCRVNKELLSLAFETNTSFVVTTDVHFLNKGDFNAHNTYININQDRDTENYRHCYLQSRAEIIEILTPQIGLHNAQKALDNTLLVADKCNVEIELGKPSLPHLDVPIDYEDESDWIRDVVFEGLKKRGCTSQEYIDRANMELDVIITKGFEGYFLILMVILQEAKRQGIPIGEGRGSAAGSLVAYAMGITNVDSVKYDLDFGRFLTMERKDLPDIDTDVATSKRGDLIDIITNMFGYDNVAQVLTLGTLASKAVVDSVGKVLDIDIPTCTELKSNINDAIGVKSLVDSKYYKDYKLLIDTCVKLEGAIKSYGCHAGAVCIAGGGKPMVDYAPTMFNQDNRVMTQFEMHDVESVGLVKYDMLGLGTLDYIDDALKFIGSDYYSFEFDFDDKETFDMLSSGKNTGVFQADSNFAERVFTSVQPSNLNELADCVAIGRPDAIQFLESYVDGKFNKVTSDEIHPELTKILSRTHGCMIYQEQLMNIFKVFGGFSDGEADKVRKIVGKKQLDDLPDQLAKFEKGALARGYSQDIIDKLKQFINDNVSYSFNMAHAVAYGITTYKTAYLKCHYPVEYMASIINNQKTDDGATDFDKIKRYIKAADSEGIKTTLPNINVSMHKFSPNRDSNSIAYGLSLIKGLNSASIDIIIANRPYTSFQDFLDKVGLELNKTSLISLIKAGAFDSIEPNRMRCMKLLHEFRFANKKEESKPINNVNKTHIKHLLDEGLITPEQQGDKGYCLHTLNYHRCQNSWAEFKDKYCKGTELDWEMEVLNSHISGDPFEDVVLPDWSKVANEDVGYLGGVVISVKETTVKNGKSKGQKMAFINLNVKGQIADIVIFSENYKKYKAMLSTGKCVVIKLKKQGDMKGIFQDVLPLDEYMNKTQHIQRKVDVEW